MVIRRRPQLRRYGVASSTGAALGYPLLPAELLVSFKSLIPNPVRIIIKCAIWQAKSAICCLNQLCHSFIIDGVVTHPSAYLSACCAKLWRFLWCRHSLALHERRLHFAPQVIPSGVMLLYGFSPFVFFSYACPHAYFSFLYPVGPALQSLLDTGSQAGILTRSRAAFRFERGIGASLPASGFVVVSRFQVVKERRNSEFRLQEAKTHSRCLLNASWLEPYAWEGSTLLSNCGAVKLSAPFEKVVTRGEAGGALLGGSSSNNVVPLGGHHGNRQALLDGSAASSVAVQAVGDGGYDLVGAFRGSGNSDFHHVILASVSGWSSLIPS